MLGSPPTIAYKTGWPVAVDKLIDRSSPALGNLDDDADLEIVVGTVGKKVYAFNPDGCLLPGWPVSVSAEVNSSAAIGDIDGDGMADVVIGVGWQDQQNDGAIYAFDRYGQVLPGWPVVTQDHNMGADGHPDGVFATPALVDLDGDGVLDVVVGSFDQYLYGLRGDGTAAPGWPFFMFDSTWSSVAVGDIDNDGRQEIVIGAYTHSGFPPGLSTVDGGGILWALDTNGQVKPGWPVVTDLHIDSSPALGDLDGDGTLEIVVGTGHEPACARGHAVYAFHADGTPVAGWPQATGDYVWPSPALADLDGDGRLEVVASCADGCVYVWNDDGTPAAGSWPVRPLNESGVNGTLTSSPLVLDLDHDGDLEVVIAIGWDIVAFNHDGSPFHYGAENQLRMHTHFTVAGTPAIADVDGDGRLDVFAGSAEFDYNLGRLCSWELPAVAAPGNAPWPTWRQSSTRHGNATEIFRDGLEMGGIANWSSHGP